MAPKIQWPLVLFSMLAGCGGCAFAFAGIANAMGESISVTLFVTIVAFVLVVVGAICSMMHLATPKHAFAAVTHLLSFSGISVELIMLGVVCALMALFAGSIVFIGNATATLVLGMLGALSGVVLAFVTGHGYLISSKPTWNTKKLPLAYTGTAAVAGGFLYVAIAGFAGADPAIVRALCWILLGCVAFSAVFSVASPFGSRPRAPEPRSVPLGHRGLRPCYPRRCCRGLGDHAHQCALRGRCGLRSRHSVCGWHRPARSHVGRGCWVPLFLRGSSGQSVGHFECLTIGNGAIGDIC